LDFHLQWGVFQAHRHAGMWFLENLFRARLSQVGPLGT
jgi:hypothetical protein